MANTNRRRSDEAFTNHAVICWFIRILLCQHFMAYFFSLKVDGLSLGLKSKIERSNEHQIKRIILRNYDKTTRPVKNDRTPIDVSIAISLYHILDTNEKEQTFTSLLAIRQRWIDEYLTWNATAFDGVETIRIPANAIWTPDLVISNFAGDRFNDYLVTNAIVSSNGLVLWLFPALIKTYCTLNVKYFPFDTQQCNVIFISWTHSGDQLDVIYNNTFNNSIYYTSENQEWAVDDITAERHVRYYACCKEPYPDVTFTIHMRRGSLFYIINLIAPCLLIFLISFLGFFLPVESGEKVNLETTILLALVVFLLMVGETMPPTPDCIPILGMFFASTMVMVTIALVMAVIVTNIYAKKDVPQRCPEWTIRLASRFYPAHFLPSRPRSLCSPTKFDYAAGNRRHIGETIAIAETDLDSTGCICCCLCHRKNHRHGDTQPEIWIHQEMFDFERSEAEWRMLAKFTDRIFFWLFVVMSCATHTTLFLQMVPETRRSAVG